MPQQCNPRQQTDTNAKCIDNTDDKDLPMRAVKPHINKTRLREILRCPAPLAHCIGGRCNVYTFPLHHTLWRGHRTQRQTKRKCMQHRRYLHRPQDRECVTACSYAYQSRGRTARGLKPLVSPTNATESGTLRCLEWRQKRNKNMNCVPQEPFNLSNFRNGVEGGLKKRSPSHQKG